MTVTIGGKAAEILKAATETEVRVRIPADVAGGRIEIVTAARGSSTHRSCTLRSSPCSEGSPAGTLPTVSTPWASRFSAQLTTMPATGTGLATSWPIALCDRMQPSGQIRCPPTSVYNPVHGCECCTDRLAR